MQKQYDLVFSKSTKNKHVYADEDIGSAIPSLYIIKDALPKQAPEKIRVTIQYEDK